MNEPEKVPLSKMALVLIWTGGILCLIGLKTTGLGSVILILGMILAIVGALVD